MPKNDYAFIPKANAAIKKLGCVNYTYSPSYNCDDNCVFKNNGCYAENAPVSWRWADYQAGKSKYCVTWEGMLKSIRQLPRGDKLRLNIAGDLPRKNGKPDEAKVVQLANSIAGKNAWTYTHHLPWSGNGSWGATIRNVFWGGLVINISCETEAQVDAYIADQLQPVITVSSTETRKQWRTAGGNRIRVCPQQLHEGVTCEQCMLCHMRPDDMAIAFKAHGTRKKTVNSTLEAIA